MKFDVKSYIENVAYNKANKVYKRHGQKRADYVYQTCMDYGWRLWDDLTRSLYDYQAEFWFRKQFGNEDLNDPSETSCIPAPKASAKTGPECWAKNALHEYSEIIEKVNDSLHGNKGENNAKRQLQNAVSKALDFIDIKPDFYDVERHGKWISKSEFNSMLRNLEEMVAKYAAVSTPVYAA